MTTRSGSRLHLGRPDIDAQKNDESFVELLLQERIEVILDLYIYSIHAWFTLEHLQYVEREKFTCINKRKLISSWKARNL